LSLGINQIFHFDQYQHDTKSQLRILIVGGRAESSLPPVWWRELLFTYNQSFPDIQIHFIGPGIQLSKTLGRSGAAHGRQIWSTSATHRCALEFIPIDASTDKDLLHSHPRCLSLLQWADLFVLFNSGMGSPPLRAQWKPTIDLLLQTHKPVLCTSHGPADMARDLAVLEIVADEMDSEGQQLGPGAASLELLLSPSSNPFASLKQTTDEKEESALYEVVTTNHSIFAFVAK
jgi:hypothetical protein